MVQIYMNNWIRSSVVILKRIEFMAPGKTDRFHFLTVEDSTQFPVFGKFELVEKEPDLKKATVNGEGYSIIIYKKVEPDSSLAMGLIVPGKQIRDKYFKLAIVGLILGITWMVIVGLTLVGWTIAAMMASAGIFFLLEIMEPLDPHLVPIFMVASIICGGPLFLIMIKFPTYNKRMAQEAIEKLQEIVGSNVENAIFQEIKVGVKIYDMSIEDKLPKHFTESIDEYLRRLGFKNGIETVAYSINELP